MYYNIHTTKRKGDQIVSFHYYGARYYWSELLAGWLSVDPMAGKYPSISPYAYCVWNPVKLVDPDGRDVDPSCLDDWNTQKKAIQDKKNELINKRNVLNQDVRWWQFIRKSQIENYSVRIESLEETLSTMGNLEEDHSTIYTLSHVEGNGSVSLIREGEKRGMISINFSSTASFVHEVTHAGQYYNNDIGFFENGAIAAYDIYDEVAAYKAALAYSPTAYTYLGKEMSMRQVSPEWVRPRDDNYKLSNGCGKHPVSIFSSAEEIKKAKIDGLLGSSSPGNYYQTYLEIPSLIYRH